MKFRAPTIVFNAFWKAGLIFGSAFCVGFFAWPWVAYGAVTLETFESYSIAALNGQSGWTSSGGAVVSTGGTKAIELDGADTASKAYNIVTTEVFAFDIPPASNLGPETTRRLYMHLCNGGDCTGSGDAGFVIVFEEAGGDFFNVFNYHYPDTYEPLAYNVPNSSTTTVYFLFFNSGIGFSTECETYGCSMTLYDPMYEEDTIDDIDEVRFESYNGTGNDMYLDNFRTMFYSEVSVDPSGLPTDYNVSTWGVGDGLKWEYPTCDIGYDCRMTIEWTSVNDGNVAYLMDEDGTTVYDTINLTGDTGRYDTFDVPASSTAGYALFDIQIENLNGYYTDELSTVGWKLFEDVWVKWEGMRDTSAIDALYTGVCADVCSDLATTSELTFWETFKDQVTCGGRMLMCWSFTPGETGKKAFKDLLATGMGMWPFSMVNNATKLLYTTDQDTYGIVENSYASTTVTLDGGVMFTTVSTTIPVLQTDMFDDFTILTVIKEKISMLLYVVLFFFFFVRVMGNAWAPNPQAIHPQSQAIKDAYTINLRRGGGKDRQSYGGGMGIDLRKSRY